MEKVIEAIRRHKKFLITAHVNLEGDSLGSQLAMRELLRGLGKEAFILDHDAVPEHYKFLPGADEVLNRIGKGTDFEAALVLDCPTLKRIGRVKEAIGSDKLLVNIDHHVSNERFGQINWVDANASSVGEMIFRLFKKMDIAMTKEIAVCLYIAILTDTGSFNYDNTSRATHEIAGELLGYGLEPAMMSENVYERRSLQDIKLLGVALSTLKISGTGDIAYLEVTKEMLKKTGADLAKAEGFVNYARSIDRAKVAILFREDLKNDGKVFISFRSKGDVDVNRIAKLFGGGGHIKASGCVIEGGMAGVKRKVLAKVEEELKFEIRNPES